MWNTVKYNMQVKIYWNRILKITLNVDYNLYYSDCKFFILMLYLVLLDILSIMCSIYMCNMFVWLGEWHTFALIFYTFLELHFIVTEYIGCSIGAKMSSI